MSRGCPVTVLFCLAFLSCLAIPAAASEPTEPVTVLATHYPPFEMSEPVQGLHGFDHEVVIEAFARGGLKAQIVYVPWPRAVSNTTNGFSPALLSCAKSEDRAKAYLFSEPISQDTYGLYHRLDFDLPEIEELKDVVGHSVASVSGYASFAQLAELGAEPVEIPSEAAGFQMLALGRIDFLYGGKQAYDFQIMQLGLSGRFGFLETLTTDYHLCISRKYEGSEELLSLFNESLAELRADGTYDRIHSRYR
jgi:polar amino acid transport system substrate-binding protein